MEDCQNFGKGDTRFWQDSHQLLALLPPEVWDHICTFLDSNDFLNLTNSSLFFRELFLQKRVFFLFKPVLELLLPKLPIHTGTTFMEYHQHQKDQANVRSPLVSCRATCKTWKWTIDRMACTFKPEHSRTTNLVQYLLSKNYTFKESQKIDKFLQNFETSYPKNVNPLPGKYIHLCIGPSEEPDYPLLINRVSTLMERYGQHIRTFETRIIFDNENPTIFHNKFVEWLNCMPNLENLLISNIFPLQLDNAEVHEQVMDILPLNINSLRKLAIETFCRNVPDEWIPDWSWLERHNLRNLILQQDNLDYLKITMLNKSDAVVLEAVTSPLKTLAVQYLCKEDDVYLSRIITVLAEKFSNTLENLAVTYRVSFKSSWHMKIMEDSFNCRLNLPKVRKFEINILCVLCLDFVLRMQDSLEELVINCVSFEDYDYSDFSEVEKEEIGFIRCNQIIKFLGYENKMLDSNIWSMFPKLRKISLGASPDGSVFRREDWMKLR